MTVGHLQHHWHHFETHFTALASFPIVMISLHHDWMSYSFLIGFWIVHIMPLIAQHSTMPRGEGVGLARRPGTGKTWLSIQFIHLSYWIFIHSNSAHMFHCILMAIRNGFTYLNQPGHGVNSCGVSMKGRQGYFLTETPSKFEMYAK